MSPRIAYRLPQNGTPRATALLVHGLNVSPRAFDDLVSDLTARGIQCVLVYLTGHTGSSDDRYRPSAQVWKDDIRHAIEVATSGPGPFIMLGYSMGGLLAALSVVKGWVPKPVRLLLLAPAIGLTPWVRAGEALAQTLRVSIPIPSIVPADFRAARFTAPCWYRALFDLYHEFHTEPRHEALNQARTHFYVSPRDELVSCSQLKEWVARRNLTGVVVREIKSHAPYWTTPNHLIVNKACLEAETWRLLLEDLSSFAA